jgi:mono/diheme cytochrome c family protein
MKSGLASGFAVLLAAAPAFAADEEVTYSKHVAPILWENCAGCHRPGEVGPFSLLSYGDAAKRAEFLGEITASRRMPPWKAEPGFGEFHDVRRLSDREIELIARWAEAGAPEGNPADLPPAPKFPEGWQLGEPDLVLEMPEAFEVPAAGRDAFRCFVIPTGLAEDRTVAAVEFRPGNRKVVHHALFFLDASGEGREKDEADPAPGYESFGGPGIPLGGSLGGWAPGATPRRLPEGYGRMLRKGSDLVLQVHYHPSGKAEADRSTVGIYFTKEPAAKIVMGLPLVNRGISIPPGEARHKVTARFTLPVDVTAVGISPHMHNLGREMKVVAVGPDGTKTPMIWIKDWDFNWQGQYLYENGVRLPKGTTLELEAFYDNTEGNPRNPNRPPKLVAWGEQTTDEMCLCGVQVVADRRLDYLELIREIGKMRGGDRAQFLRRLGGGPDP